MRLAAVALAVAGTLSGCGGPTPVATRTPLAPSPGSAQPSGSSGGVLREPAATALGIRAEQLVPLEDGLVAPRFGDDGLLQLVWIGPVDGAPVTRILATVAERRSGPYQSVGSVHAAVCPAELGLTRTRYLFGQDTRAGRLHLGGLPAVGGDVVDTTYVFAISGDTFGGSTRWLVTDDAGRERSSGDASWLASPTVPTSNDACSLTSEH